MDAAARLEYALDVRARTRRAALRPELALAVLGAIVAVHGLLGRHAWIALVPAFVLMRLRLRRGLPAPRLRAACAAGAVLAAAAALAAGASPLVAAAVAASALAAGLARLPATAAMALAAGALAALGAGEVAAGVALIAAALACR